ncbi:putative glutathione transferase [Helianthus debilis subsp. tardiflorus]
MSIFFTTLTFLVIFPFINPIGPVFIWSDSNSIVNFVTFDFYDLNITDITLWGMFQCFPAVFKSVTSHGEEQAVAEAHEALQFLENELKVKDNKFFGGDNINLVDITFVAFWIGAAEEALGIEMLPKDKFPKLTEWSDNCVNCQAVKDSLPPRENIVAFFKKRFGKAE